LTQALDAAAGELRKHDRHAEVLDAVAAARALAARGVPAPADLETLGGGCVGEEALAIAVCCALAAKDFRHGVPLAVNHSGDSDSTGAIAGNLLGALLGEEAIPAAWLAELELRAEIGRLADDLHAISSGLMTADDAWEAYPGW
jgi:ADP-ribosylglycohydrolase